LPGNTSDDSASSLAPRLAPEPEKASLRDAPIDPELARVLAAWPALAGPIKAAILALVGSASTPST